MVTYQLSRKSKQKLEGIHPDLRAVVERAIQISEVDFAVTEGLRTKKRQRQLVKAGKSRTMNSRHLTGHGVDLAAWVKDVGISWEWPLYDLIAKAMKQAAQELDVNIEWGGDWISFKDGPHFQLSWTVYPGEDA